MQLSENLQLKRNKNNWEPRSSGELWRSELVQRSTAQRLCRAKTIHVLVLTRVLVSALLLSACVSVPAYEEARSTADVEKEAHRRTRLRLQALEETGAPSSEEEGEAKQAALQPESEKCEAEPSDSAELAELQAQLSQKEANLQSYAQQKQAWAGERKSYEAKLAQQQKELVRLQSALARAEAVQSGEGEPPQEAQSPAGAPAQPGEPSVEEAELLERGLLDQEPPEPALDPDVG